MKRNLKALVKKIKKHNDFDVLTIHIPKLVDTNQPPLIVSKNKTKFYFLIGQDFENDFITYKNGSVVVKKCGGTLEMDGNYFVFYMDNSDLSNSVKFLEIQ